MTNPGGWHRHRADDASGTRHRAAPTREEFVVAEESVLARGGSGLSRRGVVAGGVGLVGGALAGRRRAAAQATPAASPVAADPAEAVLAVAREAFAREQLRALLLRVVVDGRELVTTALGESMAGVPATPAMRFRNGAVAFSYLSTLLLRFVDQGRAGLDDPVGRWLPRLPEADRVTLRMLANMTAGYADYVPMDTFSAQFYADPFRQWTPEELIALGLSQPHVFPPGTNWDYSHTNYVILGRALEAIGGEPMAALMRREVLDPMGLKDTVSGGTPAIPEPALHVCSGERKATLGIPEGIAFVEESTYWNPSWTTAQGAVQTTTIADTTASAVAIGEGTILSPASREAMVGPSLVGFGRPQAGCRTCRTLTASFSYGLGIVQRDGWLLQNPSFAGCDSIMAYLPGRKLAVALVVTYADAAWDGAGDNRHARANERVFADLAAILAPEAAPVVPRQ